MLVVLRFTQNCPSIFLYLTNFQHFNLIDFGTQIISGNEVHCASFKLFHLKIIPIKPKQVVQEHSNMFIVSSMYLSKCINEPPLRGDKRYAPLMGTSHLGGILRVSPH